MKKKLARILALTLAAMMVLTACGDGGKKDDGGKTDTPPASTEGETPSTPDETPGEGETPSGGAYGSEFEPVKDFVTYGSAGSDMSTFLVFGSENANELDPLSNCLAYMLEVDNHGKMHAAAAKEWGTEDNGLTWTFKLRDDIVWVDVNGNEKAKTTSADWMTSLEWVLNYHKNGSLNSSMPRELIAGAEEYFQATKAMDEAEALELKATGELFTSTVGIETPDEYTIVYHCSKVAPYFDSLAVSAALLPLSQAQIDEMGIEGVKSQDNTTMWYNGPYVISEFIMDNTKVFTPNPTYWDKDCYLFDSVTILMLDDSLVGQTMFMAGDVDTCNLNEANLKTIWEDPNHEWHNYLIERRPTKYSFQAHFNYEKKLLDGSLDTNWNTAIANEAFRKSLYYGLDLTNMWRRTNQIHPEKCENVAYTAPNLCFFSDGTDYADRVRELIGYPDGHGRYDAAKAQEYKEQAMQELAGKVQFPVQLDHYISGASQTALDGATVLKEIVEALGSDYIVLNIETYTTSVYREVYDPQLHSWAFGYGWGADYADPQNFLGQQCYKTDGAYYEANYSHYNSTDNPELIATLEEFTKMVKDADAITDDMDARYEAYAQAEAFLLDHAIVIPSSYSVSVGMTKSNVWAQKYASYGAQNGMYKNYITNAEAPFTTEQMDQFEADYNEGLY